MKRLVFIGSAVGVALGLVVLFGPFGLRDDVEDVQPENSDVSSVATNEMVVVKMPLLEGEQAMGARGFLAKCAACHGPNAGGIDGAGPPLIHKIYEPSHHADFAFFRAAEQGVQAHHWRFGDMPPVEGITRAEIASIIAFIRRTQRENGIQ